MPNLQFEFSYLAAVLWKNTVTVSQEKVCTGCIPFYKLLGLTNTEFSKLKRTVPEDKTLKVPYHVTSANNSSFFWNFWLALQALRPRGRSHAFSMQHAVLEVPENSWKTDRWSKVLTLRESACQSGSEADYKANPKLFCSIPTPCISTVLLCSLPVVPERFQFPLFFFFFKVVWIYFLYNRVKTLWLKV